MIRYFNLNDIDRIYELGEYFGDNFKKTNDLKEIYKNKYTKILVYEEKEKILGFIMYTELEDSVDIINIIVDEQFRKKKVASCLIDYMISDLNNTVKLITLEVRKSNIPAINLYQKFGFEIVSIRKNYYKDEDAYLMSRRLLR